MTDYKKYFLDSLEKKITKKELENLEKFLKENTKNLNKKNLEKKEIEIIVSDFDDTIFCLEEFRKADLLEGKRGEEGNKILLEKIGLNYFIDTFYKNKNYPKIIANKLKKFDLILTAGEEKIQKEKLKATNLEKINCIIVKNSSQKIFALIKYIINDLKFIPKKINIYEDRPEFFIYFKNFLQNFLQTEIDIFFVKMESNNKNPEIIKIK